LQFTKQNVLDVLDTAISQFV